MEFAISAGQRGFEEWNVFSLSPKAELLEGQNHLEFLHLTPWPQEAMLRPRQVHFGQPAKPLPAPGFEFGVRKAHMLTAGLRVVGKGQQFLSKTSDLPSPHAFGWFVLCQLFKTHWPEWADVFSVQPLPSDELRSLLLIPRPITLVQVSERELTVYADLWVVTQGNELPPSHPTYWKRLETRRRRSSFRRECTCPQLGCEFPLGVRKRCPRFGNK